MPSGACVIEYRGKRGKVFRIKFADANGRQVQETIGREADGLTRRDAEDALRARLVDVKREGLTIGGETFGAFVDRFLDVYLPTKGLKPSTVLDYTNTLRGHALPILGDYKLTELEQRPELLEGYLTELATKGLSAKTRANHVSTLHRVFEVARRWRLIRSNPVDAIEKPKVEPAETVVLDEVEIARLLTAYRELEQDDPEDVWLPVVRRMVVVGLGTALRRGELQGLRWGDVELLEGLLRVRQQFTRGGFSSPKSRASRRVVTFGPKTAEALEEQCEREPAPARRRPRLRASAARRAARRVETRRLRAEGAQAGEDREARPTLARVEAYGADLRCRGGATERLRTGEGGPLTVHDHGAVRPRSAGCVPGCCGSQREAAVRGGAGALNEGRPGVERISMIVNIDQLAPDESLSPELVLVLPPELRAQALARLDPPVWPKPRPLAPVMPPAGEDSLTRTLVALLLPRAVQLALIFVAVTAFTLVLSAVASAFR